MFITSKQLKERVQIVSDEIALRSGGKVTFEEYISLPYYGYVILRFNLNENHYTVADVDRYESLMYDCVGDEFLIDFMIFASELICRNMLSYIYRFINFISELTCNCFNFFFGKNKS